MLKPHRKWQRKLLKAAALTTVGGTASAVAGFFLLPSILNGATEILDHLDPENITVEDILNQTSKYLRMRAANFISRTLEYSFSSEISYPIHQTHA
jgi:hypothetical protein